MLSTKTKKTVDNISMWSVLVGAVNWGLVGALNTNIVTSILGSSAGLIQAVYIEVGVAGLWLLGRRFKLI